MQASNQLGHSQNTTEKTCTPTAAPVAKSGPSTAAVGGAVGGALVLIIIVVIIVAVVVLRKRKSNSDPAKLYTDVDKSKKNPKVQVVKPTNYAEDFPYDQYTRPEVPKKTDELENELKGFSPYDIVHMESKPPKSNYKPMLLKKDKSETNSDEQKPTANGTVPDDHVTQPSANRKAPYDNVILPSESHVPQQSDHVTLPLDSQVPPPKPKFVVKDKEAGENKTYAEVAYQPNQGGGKPQVRRNVEDTQYVSVEFKPGPHVEDEDSD